MDWPCLCLGNVFQLPLRLGLCVESPATVEVKLHMVPLVFCCKGHILGFVKVFFLFFLQILNAVVLLILLSALTDPDHYHFSSSELGGDFEFMDDASKYIRQL